MTIYRRVKPLKGRMHFAFAATVWKEFNQPLRLTFPGGFQQTNQPTLLGDNLIKTNQFNQPQDLTMKVMIIYDDFDSAMKASTTLQHSSDKGDFAMQWN